MERIAFTTERRLLGGAFCVSLGRVIRHVIPLTNPIRLFKTSIASIPHQHATHVNFRRSASMSNEIYPHLASILWTPEAPGQSIEWFSEILSVFIDWEYGAPRELWKLDERVVLGRSMRPGERTAPPWRLQPRQRARKAVLFRVTMTRADHGRSVLDRERCVVDADTSPAGRGGR